MDAQEYLDILKQRVDDAQAQLRCSETIVELKQNYRTWYYLRQDYVEAVKAHEQNRLHSTMKYNSVAIDRQWNPAAKKGKKVKPAPKEYETDKCPVCGKEFVRFPVNKKYCSVKCKQYQKNKNRHKA